MGRAPCCDKASVKRGPWSSEEDKALRSYLQKNGTGGSWVSLPQKAGLNRCGKSCRLRWMNYLRPDIKHGHFTEEEDKAIFTLYNQLGSRWAAIAAQLPGRTDNDVKNHWNTKLKKRLVIMAAAPPPSIPTLQMPPPPPLSCAAIKTEPRDGGDFPAPAAMPAGPCTGQYAAPSSAYVDDGLFSDLGYGSLTEILGGYGSQDKAQGFYQGLTYL